MREIKFRAWDGIKKRMVDISKEPSVESGLTYEGYFHLLRGAGFAFHVMQYTGYKDTNKKDYYEGDLVSNNLGTNKESIREIRFKDGAWVMVRVKGNSGLPKIISLAEFAGLNMPIVGNIHENPELLEQAA
jgi:uncharacterized phage protein (TIGR01671 family)